MSQENGGKFARTFPESSCKRGVLGVFLDFAWAFLTKPGSIPRPWSQSPSESCKPYL